MDRKEEKEGEERKRDRRETKKGEGRKRNRRKAKSRRRENKGKGKEGEGKSRKTDHLLADLWTRKDIYGRFGEINRG